MMKNDYSRIRPYSDAESVEAIERMCKNPMLPVFSKFLFPDKPVWALRRYLQEVDSIQDYQEVVMYNFLQSTLRLSSTGFSYDGIENISEEHRHLMISNHRDIILDPALIQLTMFSNKMPITEICAGSNLVSGNRLVADMLRCNRMITVIRGLSPRELYESSRLLSQYIRESVAGNRNSVWIAQREGRTKNGLDRTEQGILKMFDMSGEGSFAENFEQLHILPMSISYEYEPCDIKKAREVLISRSRKYVKKKGEDQKSIMTGITQWKGGIHLSVGKPISREEIESAASGGKNDRYQSLRNIINSRVIRGYRLWKTNYMGYDLMTGGSRYAGHYSWDEMRAFMDYTDEQMSKVEKWIDRAQLRQVFWEIYGNPVLSKEKELQEV